jgi:hypothetical protein
MSTDLRYAVAASFGSNQDVLQDTSVLVKKYVMFRIVSQGLRVGGVPPAMRDIGKGRRRRPEALGNDRFGGHTSPSDVVGCS